MALRCSLKLAIPPYLLRPIGSSVQETTETTVRNYRAAGVRRVKQKHTTSQFVRVYRGPSWPRSNQQISLSETIF